jgi:hypothetical protein
MTFFVVPRICDRPEVISKCQIMFERKAQTDEKAQSA